MSFKFKAAVLRETNQPLEIIEITAPGLKSGQVLTKIFYSGICHSQIMEIKGLRGEDHYLPHLLGHEATAEVISIGDGVSKVKLGDKVVLGWIKGDGLDAGGCVYKDSNGNNINSGAVTTFSEYSVVSENRVTLLPQNTPLDLAVLYGCAMPTGAGIIFNEIKPEFGKSLAVFGIGGIGMSALLAASQCKLSHLIAIDIEPWRLKLAEKLGVTHTINAAEQNVKDVINEITDGKGLDYVAEATGKSSNIELGFDLLARNGALVFASHPKAGDKISIDPFELICGKSIKGSWGGAGKPDQDIPKFDKMYQQGKLPLEHMFTKKYKLDQINQAVADLEQGLVVRALIEINKPCS